MNDQLINCNLCGNSYSHNYFSTQGEISPDENYCDNCYENVYCERCSKEHIVPNFVVDELGTVFCDGVCRDRWSLDKLKLIWEEVDKNKTCEICGGDSDELELAYSGYHSCKIYICPNCSTDVDVQPEYDIVTTEQHYYCVGCKGDHAFRWLWGTTKEAKEVFLDEYPFAEYHEDYQEILEEYLKRYDILICTNCGENL